MPSKIEWTNEVWNPVTGCTRASKGCDNCYAVRMTKRLAAMGQKKYEGLVNVGKDHFNGIVRQDDDSLTIPLRWKKPRKVFVNSMSDLFHPLVPFWFVDKVFAIMALCPHHTFQILTKRPDRMAEYTTALYRADRNIINQLMKVKPELSLGEAEKLMSTAFDGDSGDWIEKKSGHPLPNVWLGTSVEDQEAADERIPHLLICPAAVRFLSCEPLLGPVELGCDSPELGWVNYFNPPVVFSDSPLQGINWVICGGESGPNARPMHPAWARSLRDQCVAAGVPFFFKQWGEWCPGEAYDGWSESGCYDEAREIVGRWSITKQVRASRDQHCDDEADVYRIGKHKAGRVLDGRTWDEFPGGQS